MALASELAEHIVAMTYDGLPGDAIKWAKIALKDTVVRIDVMPHARRLAHTNRPDPHSSLDARFSVQYVLARALIHGQVVEYFDGEAFCDPRTREVMQRIHAAPHPDMPMDTAEHFGAEVRLTRTDGQVVTGKVDRAPSVALSPRELAGKFLNCATRVLAEEQAAALNEMIDGLRC